MVEELPQTLVLTSPDREAVWARVFAEAGEPLCFTEAEVPDPTRIRQIACWMPPADLSRYPALEVVIGSGAGVDQMPTLPEGVTLSRMIAPGIEKMVREYAVMAALVLHRDLPLYLDHSSRGEWAERPARQAASRPVGVMGMGRIGLLVAESLASLGFPVAGWSRSGAPVPGIDVFSRSELKKFLARTEILVCTLPLTEKTRGILSRDTFARLPKGAMLVHVGRGAQLNMDALIEALQTGRIAAAMLDVTDPEPLPPDHWAWSDPRVIITPHVASRTDPEEGARHALTVIRALRAGTPVPGRVEPGRGY